MSFGGGLFGSSNTQQQSQQPGQSGGLFGGLGANTNTNTNTGGGLFGSTAGQNTAQGTGTPSGGLFGQGCSVIRTRTSKQGSRALEGCLEAGLTPRSSSNNSNRRLEDSSEIPTPTRSSRALVEDSSAARTLPRNRVVGCLGTRTQIRTPSSRRPEGFLGAPRTSRSREAGSLATLLISNSNSRVVGCLGRQRTSRTPGRVGCSARQILVLETRLRLAASSAMRLRRLPLEGYSGARPTLARILGVDCLGQQQQVRIPQTNLAYLVRRNSSSSSRLVEDCLDNHRTNWRRTL
ncbi:hypothetical protein DENSPDRAFT_334796 [Dentipellis sp. KUC8613]|nr:hypothetical protein DENSPDRAFT_334796 [Dentipellis sp. KUC8613]